MVSFKSFLGQYLYHLKKLLNSIFTCYDKQMAFKFKIQNRDKSLYQIDPKSLQIMCFVGLAHYFNKKINKIEVVSL